MVARAQVDGAGEGPGCDVCRHGGQQFAVVDQVVVVQVVKDADAHARLGDAAQAQTGGQVGDAIAAVRAAVVQGVDAQAAGRRQFVIERDLHAGRQAGQAQQVDGAGLQRIAAGCQCLACVGEAEGVGGFGLRVGFAQEHAVGVNVDRNGRGAGFAGEGEACGAVGAVVGVAGTGVVFGQQLEFGGRGNAGGADHQRAHLHIWAGVARFVDQADLQGGVGAVGQARRGRDGHVDGGTGQIAQRDALANDDGAAVHQQHFVAQLHAFGQAQGQSRVGVAADGFARIIEDFEAAHAAELGVVGGEGVVQIDPDVHRLAQQAGDADTARHEGLACADGVQAGAQLDVGGKGPCGVGDGAGGGSDQAGDHGGAVDVVGGPLFTVVQDAVLVDIFKNLNRGTGVGDAFEGQAGLAGDAIAVDRAGVVGGVQPELVALVGRRVDAQEQGAGGRAFEAVGMHATGVDRVDAIGQRRAVVGEGPCAALGGRLHRAEQGGARVDVDLAGGAARGGARDGPAVGFAGDQIGAAGAGVVGRREGDVGRCRHFSGHHVQAQVGLVAGHGAGVACRVQCAGIQGECALGQDDGAADVDIAAHQVGGGQAGGTQHVGADGRRAVVDLDAVADPGVRGQLNAHGGPCVVDHAVGAEQAIVLAWGQEHTQGGLGGSVNADGQRIAGHAGVACRVRLDHAQAVVALGQLVGVDVNAETAAPVGPLVGGRVVDGQLFTGIQDAVVVDVVKNAQAVVEGVGGAAPVGLGHHRGVCFAGDQHEAVDRTRGDVVALDARVPAGMNGQVAGFANGGVNSQCQRGRGVAAVACRIDGDDGDVVLAVGQRLRGGRQEEAPAVVGRDACAAQQAGARPDLDAGGALVGMHPAREVELVATGQAVVGLVLRDFRVAQVVAPFECGRIWRRGGHVVDRQRLQCDCGAGLESAVLHAQHLRRDGVAVGGVVDGVAVEQGVRLQVYPVSR